MKLLVVGPRQSDSDEARSRAALQADAVEQYTVLTPHQGEGNVAAALRMLRESKKTDFDIVSAQDPFWSGLVAWRIARRAGAHLNVQVHSDIDAQSFIKRILAQIVLRHADSVRVVSERVKQQVERIGAKTPVTVLPVFIDLSRFTEIVRQPEQNLVLWVGRFEQEKNPSAAIEVIRSVPGAKLVMLGKGGLEAGLKQRAKGLDVEFPGWQDPAEYLARASVVLNTSPAESFGASIVEALAAGVPVVSMDVGVAKEAGANVVSRGQLTSEVQKLLQHPTAATLKLRLRSKEDWLEAWKKSL